MTAPRENAPAAGNYSPQQTWRTGYATNVGAESGCGARSIPPQPSRYSMSNPRSGDWCRWTAGLTTAPRGSRHKAVPRWPCAKLGHRHQISTNQDDER